MPRRLLATRFAIAVCLCAVSAILTSCSDKKSTTPDPPTITEVHAPWDNAEAEAMAVLMGGELAAPLELYEQVMSDLDAIRSVWGSSVDVVTTISHSPKWYTGQIEVAVDAETYATIKSGFPANWNSLNQALRIDHAVLHDSTLSLTIVFDARLSPQPLARLYAELPGVRWARMVPTPTIGPASVDGYVGADSRLYLFSRTLPSCAKLCEQADLWLFRITGSEVDSIGAWVWNNTGQDVDSLAWSDVLKVKALALGPGSSGDYPDSDLVAPAIIGAMDGVSPTSRSLLVRWLSTGDDGGIGIATGYEVSLTGPGVPERVMIGETLPRRAGQPESLLVENLRPDLSYRVVVRATDEQGNWSPWSPNAFVRSLPPWTNFTVQNSGLSNNLINSLAVDQNGRLWCATGGGGINRFDGKSWAVVLTVADRSVVNSRTLEFDVGREIIWCAAENGALCGIRMNSSSHLAFSAGAMGLSGASIAAIATAPNDDLWCSNAISGVARWDGSTWTTFSTANSGIVNNAVWDIAAAPNGDVWFGTSGGASRFDGAAWTNYTTANSDIGANIVRAIAVDANGVVICGHHDKSIGLSIFDGVRWRTQSRADSLPSTFINAIALYAPGDAWLGTTLGLAIPANPWESFLTYNSPIIDNTINALAFTADAILWIGTPKGLSRYELPIGGR